MQSDRFAHKIAVILARSSAGMPYRSIGAARLMRRPLAGSDKFLRCETLDVTSAYVSLE
jgi:hypothetical protein